MEYKINWHCRNSFLCPLSTFLFIFSFLSCSILYLFFTSNIIIELRSFFSSLSLHPKQIDKLPYRWAHLISWCVIFILSAILTTIALPDYSNNPVSGTNLEPWPVIKVRFPNLAQKNSLESFWGKSGRATNFLRKNGQAIKKCRTGEIFVSPVLNFFIARPFFPAKLFEKSMDTAVLPNDKCQIF